MSDVEKILYAIFGGIIGLAILSVIVSKKANVPQVIQATSAGLANVVAAAVNPLNNVPNNGNNANAFQSRWVARLCS